jgi:hypothetical protein
MGVLTTFSFSLWKEPYWLAHQHFFWDIGHAPNRSTSFDPQLQNKNKCAPLNFTFVVYIYGSWTLGKPHGIKPRCYGEHLREWIWEHTGNKRKKQNIPVRPPSPPSLPFKKRKNWIGIWALALAAWNFSFQNYSSLGLIGAEIWGHGLP